MVRFSPCNQYAASTRSCAIYPLTMVMPVTNSITRRGARAGGQSRLSDAAMTRRVSRCCPADGSSNLPSHGSGDAAGRQGIGRNQSRVPTHGPSSPISASSCEGSQGIAIVEKLSRQTLRAAGRAQRHAERHIHAAFGHMMPHLNKLRPADAVDYGQLSVLAQLLARRHAEGSAIVVGEPTEMGKSPVIGDVGDGCAKLGLHQVVVGTEQPLAAKILCSGVRSQASRNPRCRQRGVTPAAPAMSPMVIAWRRFSWIKRCARFTWAGAARPGSVSR